MVSVPMWEWVVARDADGGSAGVCQTRHAAMLAMTRALLQARGPRTGHVTKVIFTSPLHRQPYYVRGFPQLTAEYDGTAIRWRQPSPVAQDPGRNQPR